MSNVNQTHQRRNVYYRVCRSWREEGEADNDATSISWKPKRVKKRRAWNNEAREKIAKLHSLPLCTENGSGCRKRGAEEKSVEAQ